jgi:hypothetical protein
MAQAYSNYGEWNGIGSPTSSLGGAIGICIFALGRLTISQPWRVHVVIFTSVGLMRWAAPRANRRGTRIYLARYL